MSEEEIDPGLARLVAAHPEIFRGKPPAIFSYLMPGWYDLVDKLCADIEATLGPQNLNRFNCLQIKEKFGTLRFYWRYKAAGRPRVDVLSADRIVSFEAPPNRTAKLGQTLQVLVEAACAASETVCETCGQPGKLLCTNSWLMTRCPAHADVHVDCPCGPSAAARRPSCGLDDSASSHGSEFAESPSIAPILRSPRALV